jgi:quercetin dioxygenase-like cupin family protein
MPDSVRLSHAKSPLPVYGPSAAELEKPWRGVSRRSYSTSNATVASYAFEAGARFPRHSHAEEQITVVLDGEVEFEVDGRLHRLGRGETFVVEPGVEHSLRAGDAGARFLAIVVPRRVHLDAYELNVSASSAA